MTCHDFCRNAQFCRLSDKADHNPDRCWENLHWEDMRWDEERGKGGLQFPAEPETHEEVMEYAEKT